uniref:Uncharacterized protein n=1 Tax=Noccaea caerulescens TaxID=107243 RepID=A0A1J3IP20_NOCCA
MHQRDKGSTGITGCWRDEIEIFQGIKKETATGDSPGKAEMEISPDIAEILERWLSSVKEEKKRGHEEIRRRRQLDSPEELRQGSEVATGITMDE